MLLRKRYSLLALAVVAGLPCTHAVADDVFLKFSDKVGIVGDSTDATHKNEIVLTSYSLDIVAATSWTKGGGASVGKPSPGDFQFTANLSRAIPSMMFYIVTGQAVDKAEVVVRAPAESGKKAGLEYAKYTFEGVFFTSLGQAEANSGPAASSASFAYKTVKVESFGTNDKGVVALLSCVAWDIPAGTGKTC